jgi:hypothetical protein
MVRTFTRCCFGVLIFLLLACGGLKYSEVSKEASQFRPHSVAILPTNVGSFEQARGIVERQVATELVERQWFDKVVPPGVVQKHLSEDVELRDMVSRYLLTLQTVGQSDQEMSAAIGKKLGVEAVALANVEYWGYTTEKDEKVGKVALGLKYIECTTGTVLWKAAHEKREAYALFKPDLKGISSEVVEEIVDEMPR